jgi:threonine dehydratase
MHADTPAPASFFLANARRTFDNDEQILRATQRTTYVLPLALAPAPTFARRVRPKRPEHPARRPDPTMLTLEMILQARARLHGRLHRTPLVACETLSRRFGCRVSLKLECLQKTGSFKPRGAFNKMLSLAEDERHHGVVAVSGGNHAQGVGYGAQQLGLSAVICMPRSTPANYLQAARAYGAELVLTPDIAGAFAEHDRLERLGRASVHPFDDPLVAAGQGTVGLEIVDDAPDVTRLYVSIGGGGLITGVATAVRAARPDVHIVGVETRGADAMSRALAAGRPVELPAITSIARTLGAPKVSDFTLDAVRRLVDEVVVVEDAEAVAEEVFLLERTKVLTEPAASCCLAAAERHRDRLRPDDHVVLLLCGGNVSAADLCTFRQRFLAGGGGS